MAGKHVLQTAVLMGALFGASLASAQEFYSGVALGWSSSELDATGATSEGDVTGTSILLGVRSGIGGGNTFIGGELETSLGVDFDEDAGGSGADIDRLSRLRVVIGQELNGFTLFGTAGLASMQGNLDGSGDDTAGGYTFGVGVDVPVTEGVDVRIEALKDTVEFDGGANQLTTTGIRASAILNF